MDRRSSYCRDKRLAIYWAHSPYYQFHWQHDQRRLLLQLQLGVGDGGTSSQQNPNHAYSAAGNYIVILTVTDSNNSQASNSVTITASSPISPLSISAQELPTSGEVLLTVNFTASASGGTSPYSYSWDFGDRGSSSAQNPSHSYTNAGTYNVTLPVTDAQSSQASDSLTGNHLINPYLSAHSLCCHRLA